MAPLTYQAVFMRMTPWTFVALFVTTATAVIGPGRALGAEAAPLQAAQPAAQQPSGVDGVTATYALGEVTSIDAAGRSATVKTSTGDIAVALEESATFLRLAPGETTLDKAETITLADIAVGDRVMARGKVSDDRKSVSARQLIVMSRTAIARKQEQERADWLRRSIAGSVTAVDPIGRKITARIRTREGSTQEVTISIPATTQFKRYAPDSIRFADARPSSLQEMKTGDLLRALGEKGPDGTTFQAESIIAGSFLMVGGPIVAVRPEAGELDINDLVSQKLRTLVINKDSMVRRLPPPMAMMLARRLRGGAAGEAGPLPAQVAGAEGQPAASRPPGEGGMMRRRADAPGGETPPGGAGRTEGGEGFRRRAGAGGGTGGMAGGTGTEAGGPGPGRMREGAAAGPGAGPGMFQRPGGPPDVQEILERLPAVPLSDLKPGEAVLASTAPGANPERVTALVLASGVEPLLAPVPGAPAQAGGGEGSLGLPGDMLEFEIGLPPQ